MKWDIVYQSKQLVFGFNVYMYVMQMWWPKYDWLYWSISSRRNWVFFRNLFRHVFVKEYWWIVVFKMWFNLINNSCIYHKSRQNWLLIRFKSIRTFQQFFYLLFFDIIKRYAFLKYFHLCSLLFVGFLLTKYFWGI